jgi:hypothetical protein
VTGYVAAGTSLLTIRPVALSSVDKKRPNPVTKTRGLPELEGLQ